jgi:ribosome-binding factor A
VLLQGEVHDPDLNRLSITVGEVTISPDLRVATAWVMPLGGGNEAEAVALLARHAGELRRLVSRGLNLKFAPELRFRVDETFDRMDEARRLFSDSRVARDVAADDRAGPRGEAEDDGA